MDGLVAMTRKQSGNRNILVEGVPVQASWAETNLFPLLGRPMAQTREPGQRYTENAAIRQRDPHAVGIEVDSGWASGRSHSRLSV